MKKLIACSVLSVVISLTACEGEKGDKGDSVVGPAGVDGRNGSACHVEDSVYGAVVVCDDGSQETVFDGKDGESIKGDQGIQGVAGERGEQGPQGIPGVSCTIEALDGGAVVACGSSSVVISNGSDGSDGQNGSDGMDAASVSILNPCPTKTTKYPELILKVGDQYLSYFQDGSNAFLTTLEKGKSYQTTDARKCVFSIPD